MSTPKTLEARLEAATVEFQKLQTGEPLFFLPSVVPSVLIWIDAFIFLPYGRLINHCRSLARGRRPTKARQSKVRERGGFEGQHGGSVGWSIVLHLISSLFCLFVNKQEFALLKPHNTIYKMIGPGLVKQDQVEAKTNVEKRLEFINSEM